MAYRFIVAALPNVSPVSPASGHTLHVGPYVAQFTEYALPAGQTMPGGVTPGPDGAVWFTFAGGIDRLTGSGTIAPFIPPASIGDIMAPIASFAGALWYGADSPPLPQMPTQYLVRQPVSGVAQTTSSLPAEAGLTAMTTGGGGLYASFINPVVGGVLAFDAAGTGSTIATLPFNYDTFGIAYGPDNKLYVTATGDLATPDSAVFVLSKTGAMLRTIALPSGSFPGGIASGDGALWVTERGINSIARITTAGSVTQFTLPTPNAGPLQITAGSDGAMWFTENSADAIGRISAGGTVTEYTLPTRDAQPYGIASCPHSCQNAHGRIWVTENAAAKIAKFEF